MERSLSQLSLTGEPQGLYDPIRYMISIGGKRIRPRLALAVYSLFNDEMGREAILPALALEVFHAFTLIHDDIMDNADVRRGQMTVHRKWDGNVAILSGDTMFIKSFQMMQAAAPDRLHSVLSLFSENAIKVCEGQQYDMEFETRKFITTEDYINMISLKTGALIACSAKLGAVMAGVDGAVADSFYDFGMQLGIAFQIADDYLDTFGNESVFGKRIGGDIVRNKRTWLLVEALRRADDPTRAAIADIMDNEKDQAAKIARMQEIYVSSGVREGAVEAIRKYYGLALESVAAAGLDRERFQMMKDFADEMTFRVK